MNSWKLPVRKIFNSFPILLSFFSSKLTSSSPFKLTHKTLSFVYMILSVNLEGKEEKDFAKTEGASEKNISRIWQGEF
jgi:hypothetical protein